METTQPSMPASPSASTLSAFAPAFAPTPASAGPFFNLTTPPNPTYDTMVLNLLRALDQAALCALKTLKSCTSNSMILNQLILDSNSMFYEIPRNKKNNKLLATFRRHIQGYEKISCNIIQNCNLLISEFTALNDLRNSITSIASQQFPLGFFPI